LLFSGIRELIKEGQISENEIQFTYAGPNFNWLLGQAQKYKMENILINHGVISRDVALKLQFNSDVVLVATWNENKIDGKGILPGKIYEAIMLKKPLLSIVSGQVPNSEISRL